MTNAFEQGRRGQERLADSKSNRLAEASEWFIRLRSEHASVEELMRFRRWAEEDPENVLAYRKITASWHAVSEFAAAPEVITGRRDALEDARRASLLRWGHPLTSRSRFAITAVLATIVVTVGIAVWMHAARMLIYETGFGERRTLTLADRSIVMLDARSRIRVEYSKQSRSIVLEKGQARFDVAKDLLRPFRVRAGQHIVQALGTQFNVEVVSGTVLVTLIEGKVAVTDERASSLPATSMGGSGPLSIEMRAGEQLVATTSEPPTVWMDVDLDHVTSWQTGKLFFDEEPLAKAVERLNRYAIERIEVDSSVADIKISGAFNADDAQAFVEAVTAYFPVQAVHSRGKYLVLTALSLTNT